MALRRTVIGLFASAFFASAADAIDPQFRKIALVDGRVLSAEILSTEPQGLLVRVPQGRTLISFELLLDMVPIGQDEYDGQTPWIVYYDVAPDLEEADFVGLLKAVPGVEPQPVTVAANGIEPNMALAAAACERSIGCIAQAVANTPWKWILTGERNAAGDFVLRTKINTSNDLPNELAVGAGRDQLWEGLHAALALKVPPGSAPKGNTAKSNGPKTGGGSKAVDERRVVALSFIPLPGVPSMAQKDGGGVALAFGVVVPSTALWVGAVGQNRQPLAEFGLVSFAGYYAVTVLANQVAGFRSLDRTGARRATVTALPTDHGAQVVLIAR